MKKFVFVALMLAVGCGGNENEVGPVPEDPVVDAGTPDAGNPNYPWFECVRHSKSQGHGKGLEKFCY